MAKKQSSPRMSSLGSKAMAGKPMTKPQTRSLGASIVSQDDRKGQKPTKKR